MSGRELTSSKFAKCLYAARQRPCSVRERSPSYQRTAPPDLLFGAGTKHERVC